MFENNGIFLGSKKTENIFIFIHGLGSSLFGHVGLAEKLVDKNNSILLFNNRGNGIISKTYQLDEKSGKYKSHKIGMAHDILPERIWPDTIDAQRFISLFTSDSVEEIFSYASSKNPKLLRSVKLPKLVVLAENDEYKDRAISEIANWFEESLVGNNTEIKIIKNANHSFKENSDEVSKEIKNWIKKI